MHNEYKIEALMRAKTGEEAFSAERIYFVKTDRMYNPRKTIPYKYFTGSLPVLISAPHAVRHIRHKRIKPSDEFTGSMAFLLNKLTGCHAIAATKLYGGDPNFDDKCIYKEALKNLAAEQEFKLILDLHGASRDHSFDIDIGTIHDSSLMGKIRYKELLKKHLNQYGISQISDNYFSVSGNNTITKYTSSELGFPAVQLEINKRFRVPHQNPGDYCRLIGALADFIQEFA